MDSRKSMQKKGMTGAGRIAISFLALFFVLILCTVSLAGVKAGMVTHLSGPLFAKKADGTTMILSINSVVEQGDLLVTEKGTYARIKFTDNGELTMRPNTRFKISQYNFDSGAPKMDVMVINLIKGGMRSMTGMIGKRGDQDSYKMMTNGAIIGIRGTTYEGRICEGNCGLIPDGFYLLVLEGIINVRNSAGSKNINAGQYAYVKNEVSEPQILPGNPGLDFTLPPSFRDVSKDVGINDLNGGCVVR